MGGMIFLCVCLALLNAGLLYVLYRNGGASGEIAREQTLRGNAERELQEALREMEKSGRDIAVLKSRLQKMESDKPTGAADIVSRLKQGR